MNILETNRKIGIWLLYAILSFGLAVPFSSHAATFVVNDTMDAVDVNPGDGVCADADDKCTLRAAILETNALPGADNIELPGGTYILRIENPGFDDEDASATGDLDVTDDITITGSGANASVIDGNHIDRVLHINGPVSVVISGVTITNGFLGLGDVPGGGIFNDSGTLNLSNSTVTNNTAGDGGGIKNFLGTAILTNCTISGNETGGIFNSGLLTLANCTVSGNSHSGIGNSPIGTATLTDCTVSDNGGPGIDISRSTLTVTNCTVSENKSFTIIVDNEIVFVGGGIRNREGAVTVVNTIVAKNDIGDCTEQPVTSLGFNLDSDGGCNLTEPTDLPNTDPLLGEFIESAVPGQGHFPLLPDSPAIDTGNNDPCSATDQIGNGRVDGNGDGIVTCDVGAIESQTQNVNELVTFVPVASTYSFTRNTSGCPSGFVGKFGFDAQLTNVSESALTDLYVQVAELSNGNLLLTSDGTIGVGDVFPVPTEDGYSDGILVPAEYVDVPFTICLKKTRPFTFFVDVLGLATKSSIRVKAHIDGRSQLILSGNTAQWHHFDYAAPGRHLFQDEPTVINEVEWFPVWPDIPDEENRDCNCISDEFFGVSPPLPLSEFDIRLRPIQSRGVTRIVQEPNAGNNHTLIVEFDDNPIGGSNDYVVDIGYTAR